MNTISKHKEDIEKLIKKGDELARLLIGTNDNLIEFRKEYEIWYSEGLYLIKQILPDRLDDFRNYYDSKKGGSLKFAINYTPSKIEELLKYSDQIDFARSLFTNQLNIVKSAERRFESSLFQIREVVQADLFDSELEAAKELNKKGFFRAAGAVSGVVLEKDLYKVCINHNIKIIKKNPTINDYNDLLKNHGVIEIDIFRFIQRLADLRNLCDHHKNQEPTKDQILELIEGVDKIIKTVF
jgi:hypothetical protein